MEPAEGTVLAHGSAVPMADGSLGFIATGGNIVTDDMMEPGLPIGVPSR